MRSGRGVEEEVEEEEEEEEEEGKKSGRRRGREKFNQDDLGNGDLLNSIWNNGVSFNFINIYA